jgi:hypothetical protein
MFLYCHPLLQKKTFRAESAQNETDTKRCNGVGIILNLLLFAVPLPYTEKSIAFFKRFLNIEKKKKKYKPSRELKK